MRPRVLLLSLLLASSLAGCGSPPPAGTAAQSAMDAQSHQHAQTAAALAAYFAALRGGDPNRIPLDTAVTFQGPVQPLTSGEAAVRRFITDVAQGIKDIRVKRTIIEGENACAIIDFETAAGVTVPIADCFRVVDGKIVEIRPYFDPRPLLPRQ